MSLFSISVIDFLCIRFWALEWKEGAGAPEVVRNTQGHARRGDEQNGGGRPGGKRDEEGSLMMYSMRPQRRPDVALPLYEHSGILAPRLAPDKEPYKGDGSVRTRKVNARPMLR